MAPQPPTPPSSIDAPLPSSFDNDPDFFQERRLQKLFRRLREEPLIPIGCALTCWALYGAGKAIRQGRSSDANRMFRRRIYAQGFTILAMGAGNIYWQSDRQKRKEYDKVVAERKAREKRDAWIRELEARDQEEKEIRAKLAKAKAKPAKEKLQGLQGDGAIVGEGVIDKTKDMIEGKKPGEE